MSETARLQFQQAETLYHPEGLGSWSKTMWEAEGFVEYPARKGPLPHFGRERLAWQLWHRRNPPQTNK